MQKLFTAEQIRAADKYTIEHEPVSSMQLMERASQAFVNTFCSYYPERERKVSVYCGTGNNGGDGLAIARLLVDQGYQFVDVKVVRFSPKETADFQQNLERLIALNVPLLEITESDCFPIEDADLIIDAIFGSGLNKPLEGAWKELVLWLKSLDTPVVSVDIPSGFRADGPIDEKDIALKSELTVSFQFPKINFLLPESAKSIDHFEVVDIGLHQAFTEEAYTPYFFLTADDIKSRLKKRKPFSHKGTFGHALIVAGAAETMGAALLCAEAALRAGSGLTTACIPAEGLVALNARCPEIMALVRMNGNLPENVNWVKYNSVAIGPGLGTSAQAKIVLEELLKNVNNPIVLDADALNLLSENSELLRLVPEHSVLTPHVKEFDRIFGEHKNWWDRVETGRRKAAEMKCYIVLKNRYSIVLTPEQNCIFNPTGTPAMASGGMGDVLTGVIASFLAQGYSPESAVLLAVYLHGSAAELNHLPVVTATDVIKQIPATIAAIILGPEK